MGNMDIGNVCTEGGVTLKTITEAKKLLTSGALDEKLEALCASKDAEILAAYRERLIQALDAFAAQFGTEREVALFSAAGRTELGGNHTDHQRGHVLAASVNLDIIAVAAMRDDDLVQVKSKGFPMDIISLEELAPQTDKKPDSAELVRGVAARFRQLGYSVKRGFDAYTESQVMQGSGLSSSAAFEVLLGNICNTFYAENQCSAEEIAEIGQFAENVYFRKPCGLMDQMASSVGGVVAIDFADAAAPQVEPVSFDFSTSGYALCIVKSCRPDGRVCGDSGRDVRCGKIFRRTGAFRSVGKSGDAGNSGTAQGVRRSGGAPCHPFLSGGPACTGRVRCAGTGRL